MNDIPTPTPYTAPPVQRNRRSGRAQRRGRHGKNPLITWWQGLILLALAGVLAYQAHQLVQANLQLKALYEEREAAQAQYERMVKSHQVKYRDLILQYAEQYDLNPAYVSAIIKQESDYNPQAVSSKGARGLMQFMPDTFDWVKKNCGYRSSSFDVVFEPEASIKMGCYLLNYIISQLGSADPILVACAYHAGWGTVPAWLKNYSSNGQTLRVEEIPKDDTRIYAGRVLNSYAVYAQYAY